MRIGLIARADNGGLGIQTWEFYRHLQPDKTLVVDISDMTGYPNHFDRYPGADVCRGYPTDADLCRFLDGVDVVFSAETPYNWDLFRLARERGVRTVLQYNFEFLEFLRNPEWPIPDLFAAPSLWRFDDVRYDNKIYLPAPVNREVLPFRQRYQARTFVHIAGHPTTCDRNGTDLVLSALHYVTAEVGVILWSQHQRTLDPPPPNVTLDVRHTETANYWDLYAEGDVLLLPRRYGGLSLQLNEAMSVGMPIIATDLEPQNLFLPQEGLVPTVYWQEIFTTSPISVYNAHPRVIAAKIDEFAADDDLVARCSAQSGELAAHLAWDRMAPIYHKVLAQA